VRCQSDMHAQPDGPNKQLHHQTNSF
jgi:hypothetical protein